MWASESGSWVFIGVPRCGTRSFEAWLRGRGAVSIGPQHATVIPSTRVTASATVWAVIRDPLQRAISAYLMYFRRKETSSVHEQIGGQGFEEFCRYLVAWSRERELGVGVGRERVELFPQHVFHDDAGVEQVVRLEELPECLEALPFVDGPVNDFPHVGRSEERRPQVTDHAKGLVRVWAREDYRRWFS